MYEQIFQFNSRPFTSTPYVKHYFAGDAIHTALGQARVSIDRAAGPVIVIGGPGNGKTLLLAMLEEQYQSQFSVVNLACARLGNREQLLQSILFELQLPYKGLSETELRFALIEFLNPSEKSPNGVLLLVDEAQSLSTELLDELRLVTNFVRDGQPRIRLVMAGSSKLEENLADSKLESFNQRIAARCYLQTMSRDETARYVTEHIDRAGGSGIQLFAPESLKSIHEVSDGCPRLINQVCDHALILAATHGLETITSDCVQQAWADVQSIPGSFNLGDSTPNSGPADASQLESDESWTVIEFGQLDEDDAPVSAATEPASHEPQHETSDTETWPSVESDHQTSETEIASLETDAESQANHQDLEEQNDREEAPTDPIPADLSAILGSEPESQPSIEELEEQQEQILDQVDNQVQNTNGILGATAGIAGVAAAFGAANLGELQDEMPSEEPKSEIPVEVREPEPEPAPSAEEPDSYELQPLEEETTSQTFQPEPIVQESMEEPVTAEQPVAEQVDEQPATEMQPTTEQPVDVVDDPFNESFEAEENLIDRYAPFVAHQNQSSLNVSSDQLAMLAPQEDENEIIQFQLQGNNESDSVEPEHEPSVGLESTQQADDDSDSVPEEVSAEQPEAESSQQNYVEQLQTPVMEPEQYLPTVETEAQPEPAYSSFEESDEEKIYTPYFGESPSESQEEETSTPEPDEAPVNEAPVNEAPVNEAPASEATEEQQPTSEAPPSHHVHVETVSSQDIREQAEAILRRLNVSPSVSHETPLAERDASYQQDTPTESEVGAEASTESTEQNTDGDFARQNAALDESQKILNEILEQKNALTNQRDSTPQEQPLKMEYPLSDASQNQSNDKPNDDREMIIVNRMEQPVEKPPTTETATPFTSTPVSTGRAERMDYEQLFNQLRDINQTDE